MSSPFFPHGCVNCFRMTLETTCWSGSFWAASGISSLTRCKISRLDGISPNGAAPTATLVTCLSQCLRANEGRG